MSARCSGGSSGRGGELIEGQTGWIAQSVPVPQARSHIDAKGSFQGIERDGGRRWDTCVASSVVNSLWFKSMN